MIANTDEIQSDKKVVFEKYNEKVIERIYHITERAERVTSVSYTHLTFHRELHSRKWKKPLSKHWNYIGNGKKAGNERHLDTKGEVYLLVVNKKSAFFCFPRPTPYPFGLPADYQTKRQ